MGLAGNMKLSTFITALACTGVIGGVLAYVFWPDPEPAPEPTPHVATTHTEVPQPEVVPILPDPVPAGSDLDAELLSWAGRDLGGASKKKDVSSGKPYKINVYQDDTFSTANRAKVDLDRDDKWDIKITYGDVISRKVSSADDEDYDVEEVWNGEAWVSP